MCRFTYNDGGRKAAGYSGTTGDCVVRAVAIATEQPYQGVYDAMAEINAKYRGRGANKVKSARNGVWTRSAAFDRFIESIGWVWKPTMFIGSGCKVHLRADELPLGRLIVSVSKHVVAVVDGVIHDTYDCSRDGTRCVYGYWQKGV